MTDKKTVLCPVFRHLNPTDFENWLEQMAAKGWHIDRIRQWSSMLMTFRRGEPKKYRFIYDPQVSPRKDYISTYEQFGWEYLGRMASAHIWREEYEDQRPESFSDQESLVKRNRRNIAAVSVSFTIFLLTTLAVGVLLLFFTDTLAGADRIQVIIADVLSAIITIALGMVMVLLRKNESY
jgi:hypothetical protein